jgi:hypothetical protein
MDPAVVAVPESKGWRSLADCGRAQEANDRCQRQRGRHRTAIEQVDVEADALVISMKQSNSSRKLVRFRIAWTKPPSKRRREILLPSTPTTKSSLRPIRSDARGRLIAAIVRGRAWLDEIVSGAVTGTTGTTELATRERRTVRTINMTISLAFLAPTLIRAVLDGTLPRGVGYAGSATCPQNGHDNIVQSA